MVPCVESLKKFQVRFEVLLRPHLNIHGLVLFGLR